MAKMGSRWQNNSWGDIGGDYSWQDTEPVHKYIWLKKIIIATLLFMMAYGAHRSDTTMGQRIDEAIQYTVSVPTDFTYVVEQITSYAPPTMDLSALKRVQAVVSRPADPLLYMIRPSNGRIVSAFGLRVNPITKQEMLHEGIDIEVVLGENIRASAAGKVKAVVGSAQYGNTLIVEHSQDVDTVYGHLGEILVNQGDLVSQGQVIGKGGATGIGGGSLLYFEVREKGKAIDPMTRFKGDLPTGEGK